MAFLFIASDILPGERNRIVSAHLAYMIALFVAIFVLVFQGDCVYAMEAIVMSFLLIGGLFIAVGSFISVTDAHLFDWSLGFIPLCISLLFLSYYLVTGSGFEWLNTSKFHSF
jgi:hypothetical protein